ncbi:hypothetical protein DACRYDRAFT_21818 [Dacryopinax primogenitus]|uniref:Uncharacterized protein n=1 Tax=Dacryopinax primogenitus (strain DJM 731) TaxID=1858805 RepID=M5G3R7_DACPD|nr:uncharacterized protein DACRYDRAFT_21818 [Dacryopinax primogenitus]EJU02860.1 hypothetical protein DACRYDRAFT_21818 [Dacryopinax primogenitus]
MAIRAESANERHADDILHQQEKATAACICSGVNGIENVNKNEMKPVQTPNNLTASIAQSAISHSDNTSTADSQSPVMAVCSPVPAASTSREPDYFDAGVVHDFEGDLDKPTRESYPLYDPLACKDELPTDENAFQDSHTDAAVCFVPDSIPHLIFESGGETPASVTDNSSDDDEGDTALSWPEDGSLFLTESRRMFVRLWQNEVVPPALALGLELDMRWLWQGSDEVLVFRSGMVVPGRMGQEDVFVRSVDKDGEEERCLRRLVQIYGLHHSEFPIAEPLCVFDGLTNRLGKSRICVVMKRLRQWHKSESGLDCVSPVLPQLFFSFVRRLLQNLA